jgi:DNA-binding NtrC family response regulator
VERLAAAASAQQIAYRDLPPEVRARPEGRLPTELLANMPYKEAVETAHDRISRYYLVALMREFHGNVTHAAERAGMERESLHRLLRRQRDPVRGFQGVSAPLPLAVIVLAVPRV